jgi:hypothetical protein
MKNPTKQCTYDLTFTGSGALFVIGHYGKMAGFAMLSAKPLVVSTMQNHYHVVVSPIVQSDEWKITTG